MKDLDEEVQTPFEIDVENVALHLLQAYPNANYVALNTGLTVANQNQWKDHWYFIGFVDEPVYKELDGYPAWVARKDINFSEEEWGLFFLHISSKDHVYRGVPIQKSPVDFASPRFFCWKINPDRASLMQIVTEEIEPVDDSKEFNANFKDMIESTLLNPVMNALKPSEDRK